nr:cathepsin O [Helicoverpa armigera]
MTKWWNWVLGIALFCLLFVAIPITLNKQKSMEELKPMFDDYIAKFNKSYRNPEEYMARFQHFVASVREIELLNAGSRGPDHCKAKYGLTRLSDMSKTEFKDIHLSDEKLPAEAINRRRDRSNRRARHTDDGDCNNEPHNNVYVIIRKKRAAALPLQVDWRTKGVIGPIQDQGLCGACWAFSTVGTIEAMSAIKTGKLDKLSVQEAIDCAGLGNSGCAGGDICLLLDWLTMTDTAIPTEAEYPLRLTDGVCKAKKNSTGVKVKTFTCDDFVGSEDKILTSLANHGPVTVAVNALTWQHYLGGVIQFHCSGSALELNHAVELVGYDLTGDVPFYIAKNSWGKDFGNAGYLNLAIGSNICGLANEVASVDVK